MHHHFRPVFWKDTKHQQIFLTKTGSIIEASAGTKMIQRHNTRSGLSGDISSRNLRRSTATIADDKDLDEEQVANKMDHNLDVHKSVYVYCRKSRREKLRLNKQLRAITNER